ncbi:MAG: hypothetical protein U1E46_12970 [Hyphomicrobiales bacterium]
MPRPLIQQSHAMTILLVKMFKGRAECHLDDHALRDLGLSRMELDYAEEEGEPPMQDR